MNAATLDPTVPLTGGTVTAAAHDRAAVDADTARWEGEEREIIERIALRTPSPAQTIAILQIRNRARSLARELFRHVPPCRERSVALKRLEESFMFATEAVLRRGYRAPRFAPGEVAAAPAAPLSPEAPNQPSTGTAPDGQEAK